MADYQKMYAILCKAVDEAIDPLERVGINSAIVKKLQDALLDAEEVYINTSVDSTENNGLVLLQGGRDSKKII